MDNQSNVSTASAYFEAVHQRAWNAVRLRDLRLQLRYVTGEERMEVLEEIEELEKN